MTPTPSKRRVAATSFVILLHQKKLANNAISCIFVRGSWPVSSSFGLVMINYLPLNQFWIVFGNLYSSHYVRSAANQKKYDRCVKYFYSHLSFIIQSLHLLEIETLFRAVASFWLSTVNGDI